jgi:hypothetical protein
VLCVHVHVYVMIDHEGVFWGKMAFPCSHQISSTFLVISYNNIRFDLKLPRICIMIIEDTCVIMLLVFLSLSQVDKTAVQYVSCNFTNSTHLWCSSPSHSTSLRIIKKLRQFCFLHAVGLTGKNYDSVILLNTIII